MCVLLIPLWVDFTDIREDLVSGLQATQGKMHEAEWQSVHLELNLNLQTTSSHKFQVGATPVKQKKI